MKKRVYFTILAMIMAVTIIINLVTDTGYYVTWIVFGGASLVTIISLSIIIISLFVMLFNKLASGEIRLKKLLMKTGQVLLSGACLMLFTVVFSELVTFTPDTADIALIEKVNINRTEQYITVRGNDESNPVILFLAGGPGGSQLQATRMMFNDLEDDYTIINWEQPGSGMSYDAYQTDDLTVQRYIEDAHELTQYIKEQFSKEKIYIIGESWGSYLAIELAHQYPEDYYSIITAGQMVDFVETEIYCYNKALEIARDRNDQDRIDVLEKQGLPPYHEGNLSLESGTYLLYLHDYMNSIPEVNRTSYDTLDDLFSPEYSITDSINYMRALLTTFDHVYRQLYDIDLRESRTEISIPVYMIHGKYDMNAPLYLAQDYYEKIEAPDKEFLIFQHSGHNPWINEPTDFCNEVRRLFNEE